MNSVTQILFLIMIFLPVHKSDYILYEVTAFSPRERAILYNLQSKVSSVIFLNGVSNEAAIPMSVIVNKKIFHMFESRMQNLGIQCNRVSQIKTEQLTYQEHSAVSPVNISDNFYDWDEILKWIRTKINDKFEKIVVAKTYEKRDIFFLKIKSNRNNPTVFIVGGEEGMDWISSTVILNLFNDFLENADGLKMLMENYNFYFMPILNPDGFVYSKNQDRFWSKNRRMIDTKPKCEGNSEPIGVNIDRNWFFKKTLKRKGDECKSVYIGHKPLSEEENESLSYVLNNLALSMIAFINVRGFGRYITVPYADVTAITNNNDIVLEILKAACFRVRRKHNITFDIGQTSNYFYFRKVMPASIQVSHELNLYSSRFHVMSENLCNFFVDNFTGNMADWVKKKLNTPLVYTVYLEDISNVLPHPKSIKTISKQFYSILNESLLVTQDIYGPLFNYEIKAVFSFLLFNTIFVLQLLLYIL